MSSFRPTTTTSTPSTTTGHHPPLPPYKPSPNSNSNTVSEPGGGTCVVTVTIMDKQQQPLRYDETSGGRLKTSSAGSYASSKTNGSVIGTGNGSIPTSTYSNGSSLTGTGMTTTGLSSSTNLYSTNYRLASLDRLAQRQKLYETNGSGGGSSGGSGGDGGTTGLQNKRELFFKNDTLPAPALVTSINSNTPPVMKSELNVNVTGQSSKPDILKSHSHPHHINGIEDHKEKQDRDKKMTSEDKKIKILDGYVGFANLPNQVYRKAVKKGFDFTLMVVGTAGLGKSTLINSMFLTDIYSAEYPGPSLRVKKTVQVETSRIVLKENGVNLTLTIVDTPGFGDAVDNSNCWQPVMDFVESRYEDFLNSESRVDRTKKPQMDSRVHVCLYFIAPSGHGLKPLDIELMKKLADKVNLIPIIGKADTMTPEECTAFKKQILNELTQQKIKIYSFPDIDDEEENKINKQMRDRVPFAVVGSNTILEIDGKKLRGRKYPWGTVVVENTDHSDFVPLRNMILRTHLQDLKDVTNNVHYENYRVRKLAGIGTDGKPVNDGIEKNPLAQMEDEKKNHDRKMKKMEQEMEIVFEMKVKERNQRLIDSEVDLKKREESMKKSLEKLEQEIEERKKTFESEKLSWEQAHGMTFDELRRKNMENLTKETSKRESGVIVTEGDVTSPTNSTKKKSLVKRSKSLRQSDGSTRSQHECRPM